MIYVSVVSHNHFDLIKEIGCLEELSKHENVKVVIRDNISESNFDQWCKKHDIIYTSNNKFNGFGKNHNLNFEQVTKLGAKDNDLFLVLNPDLHIQPSDLLKLKELMKNHNVFLATINLYRDNNFLQYDNSVRKFPKLKHFVSSILFGVNSSILNKDKLDDVSYVEWAAGSFLMFQVSTFRMLKGFDEKYYLYCEDIDICKRYSQVYGENLLFSKSIKGIHYARFNNRKILSKHFYWHIKSTMRYLLKFR